MEQDLYQTILDSPIFPWAISTITGMIGFVAGNRAAIGRDDRNRRIAIFSEMRRKLNSAIGHTHISPADSDAVLAACVWWRRNGLRRAIERCNEAADGYYTATDAWGSPLSSAESEAAMRAALDGLVSHLRKT